MELLMPNEDYVGLGYWKNKNIYEYLKQASLQFPDRIAVVDRFGRYTYQELKEQVQKLAGALLKHGIRKGDVISYQLPNWYQAVVIHQAAAMIGAICNPIIPIYRQKETRYILTQSQTKIIFIPYVFRKFNYLEMIRSIIKEIPSVELVVVVDPYHESPVLNKKETDYSTFVHSGCVNQEIAPINERDPVLLLYTSGTTANPKGVLHTHNTLLHENQSVIDLYHLGSDDTIFMPSPVTHITGVICGLELPFIIKGKVVLQDIWDPHEAIRLLIDEECTWSLAATPFLKGIIQNLNESGRQKLKLKAFPCGGADVPPELVKQAAENLNCLVARMYGSSEIPSVSTCGYEDSLEKAAFTDGKILSGIRAKIVNNQGEELSAGEIGELAVKGPEMFLGYIQSEYNQDSFLPDGYFLTGDLAVMDEDGYIEIKGRKKDIIIRGGENISVKELEDLLYQHPKIANVAIVAMPDEEMGEKACAYVVLKAKETFSFEEMVKFLKDKGIANQKLPERLEIIEQMPMTASGKIQKFILRDDIRIKLKTEQKVK